MTLLHSIDHGSMFADDAAQTITISAVETYYPMAAGMGDGGCSAAFTFQNSKELKCNIAGTYLVTWNLTVANSISDTNSEGLVLLNTTPKLNTVGATRTKENGVDYHIGGTGILTLAVNDLLKLAVGQEAGTLGTITINHANLTVLRIG